MDEKKKKKMIDDDSLETVTGGVGEYTPRVIGLELIEPDPIIGSEPTPPSEESIHLCGGK